MQPRIAPLENPDPKLAEELAKTRLSADGRPLNVFTTLARHPLLLKRVNALGGVFRAHGTLPSRQRELVILRAAGRLRSRYEFAQHAPLARRLGLTEEQIEGVTGDLDPAKWSAEDQALLRFADELLDRGVVEDSSWAAMAVRLDAPQLLELVFLVGYYRMLAGYLQSVQVQLEPGLELPAVASGDDWR